MTQSKNQHKRRTKFGALDCATRLLKDHKYVQIIQSDNFFIIETEHMKPLPGQHLIYSRRQV